MIAPELGIGGELSVRETIERFNEPRQRHPLHGPLVYLIAIPHRKTFTRHHGTPGFIRHAPRT
jgi:hypothetical protein